MLWNGCIALLLLGSGPLAWQTLTTPHFQLQYPPALERTAKDLSRNFEPIRAEILTNLGAQSESSTLVVLAPDPQTFLALQPPGVPDWASATSYPNTRTIFLKPLDPREIRANTLPGVFAHELAHLILHQRLNNNAPPRWLDEGIANRFGRSLEWEFPGPLLVVGVTGRYLPFPSLEHGFPETGDQAHLAYAQSTDFVQFLHRSYGPAAFSAFLDRLAAGDQLDSALSAAFGQNLASLSAAWLKRVRWIYGLIGIITGGIPLWFGIALLAIWAYARKLTTSRLRKQLWDLEDRAAALQASAPNSDDPPPPPPTYH